MAHDDFDFRSEEQKQRDKEDVRQWQKPKDRQGYNPLTMEVVNGEIRPKPVDPTRMDAIGGKIAAVRNEAVERTGSLPRDAAARKSLPICTGVLDYFPDALAAVAEVSRVGNDQHNPGQPLHWAKGKSTDHADSLVRHMLDRGKLDVDKVRHSAKVAWRALALLQTEIEAERLAAEFNDEVPF